MANLGQLVVNLEANIAQFTRDMGKASQSTDQAMKQISGAVDSVQSALAALGVGASAAGFALLIKNAVDAADNLRDMSQKTGIAVGELDGLGFAAGQAGGSLESMEASAGKLNKAIAEAAGGNAEAKEAFKALGISVTDASGNLKKADVIMAEVADQFQKYQDGPQKSAIALRLFGKAGADMVPLLNEGGDAMRENIEYAKRYSGATSDLSDMADNFNDTLGKLAVQQRGFVNDIATQLLPTMQRLGDAFLTAAENGNTLHTWSGRVAESIKVLAGIGVTAAFVFEDYGIKIGAAAAKMEAYSRLDFKGVKIIEQASLDDLDKARVAYEKLRNDIRTGASGKDGFGKLFDKLEGQIADERELLMTRNQMVAKTQNDGLMSIKDANTAKVGAQTEYVKNIKALYNQEIAVLMAAQRFAKTPDAAAAIQSQIDGIYKKQSLAGSDVSKPAAPILESASKKRGKSDAEKAQEEGARLVAKLKEQDEAYGLAGAALLQYQLAGMNIPQALKDQALAHQVNIDAMKSSELASESLRREGQEALQAMEDAAKRTTEKNAQDVERIRAEQMNGGQIEAEVHAARMEALQLRHDEEFLSLADFNAMIEAETQRHEDSKAQIRMQSDRQIVDMVSDSASQLYSVMQQAGLEQTALGRALFVANKALAVAEIIMNTEVAASAALKVPVIGTGLAVAIRAMGYASAGVVIGTTIASAEGGYDIPAGTNPVTQLHEKEMVLPRQHADVIRSLARGGGGGAGASVTYAPQIHIDSRTDQAEVHRLVSGAVRQGNADLVDQLSRAGIIQ